MLLRTLAFISFWKVPRISKPYNHRNNQQQAKSCAWNTFSCCGVSEAAHIPYLGLKGKYSYTISVFLKEIQIPKLSQHHTSLLGSNFAISCQWQMFALPFPFSSLYFVFIGGMETLWRKYLFLGELHMIQTLQSHTFQLWQTPLSYTVICSQKQKMELFLQRIYSYVF